MFITIERLLARFCTDQIVVVSDQQRFEICETYGIGRPGQFRVVPLGVDLEEFGDRHGEFRAELGIRPDEVAIGIVGRLCEVKNHAMLVDVAARLSAQSKAGTHRSASFSLVTVIFARISRGGLVSLGSPTGGCLRVSRGCDISLCGFDMVVLTSLNEGTPLTLIEAMCSSRAVVPRKLGVWSM